MVAFSTWKRTLSADQILNTYTPVNFDNIYYLEGEHTFIKINKKYKLTLHIIWEALNYLLSVMFECQVSLLSVACIFKPAQLLIAFQQQVTDIAMHKNDGLENYLQKQKKKFKIFFFFCIFHIREILSHSRECASQAQFPGGSRMVREGSHLCKFSRDKAHMIVSHMYQ